LSDRKSREQKLEEIQPQVPNLRNGFGQKTNVLRAPVAIAMYYASRAVALQFRLLH
jgi:hypothetical protein